LSSAYCSPISSWASSLTGEKTRRARCRRCRRAAAELDLLLEAGDADLEELVEVARDDAEEAQALEQRHASSAACASTRRLKASRDSSRLRKCSGG
jgi:hypothetical protein